MRDFFDWKLPNKPVLILGKGPSLERRAEVDEDKYLTVGINQVPNVDISHQIDWEVTDFTRPFVLMPYFPLLHREPHDLLVPNLSNLWCYNFKYAPRRIGTSPVIDNYGYSVHCIIRLFHHCGVSSFKTLGIDGGRGLAKGMTSPDQDYTRQFKGIRQLEKDLNVAIQPL